MPINFPREQTETIKVLWAAVRLVEEKRGFSKGHSKRVAELCLMTGEFFKLEQPELVNLYAAGLLHDIGYIAIPDELFEKDGEFTTVDKSLLETAKAATLQILSECTQLKEVARIIKYANLDNLNAQGNKQYGQIPTASNILKVAEAFDALNSARPHRNKMPITQIIETLEKDTRRYNQQVVRALFRAIRRRLYGGLESDSMALEEKETEFLEFLGEILNEALLDPKPYITIRKLANSIKEVFADESASIAEMSQRLALDSALSQRLMAAANSPLISPLGAVKNLDDALIFLGVDEARLVVTSALLYSFYSFNNTAFTKIARQWWADSVLTGCISKMLAEKCHLTEVNFVYLLGLLRNIGKNIILKKFDEKNGSPKIETKKYEALIKFIEANHSQLSSVLYEQAGMPTNMDAPGDNPGQPDSQDEDALVPVVLHTAEEIVKAIRENRQYGEQSVEKMFDTTSLDIPDHMVAELVRLSTDKLGRIEKLLGISDSPSGQPPAS